MMPSAGPKNLSLRAFYNFQCPRPQMQATGRLLLPSTCPPAPAVHHHCTSQQQQSVASCFALHSQGRRNSSQLARAIAPRPGTTAETYVAYGMTQKLFEACSNQADYKIPQLSQKGAQVPKTSAGEDLGVGEGWWYEELGLVPTFSTWSQVTFLHMYLLTVRLRALPSHESLQTYSRHLIDHFSHNAEHRMDVLHGLSSRGIRNKFLKDLFIQWRGVLAAYDEGLVKGDAVLGAAVWRNLWKANHTAPDGKDLDWSKIAQVVAYMRRVLSELSQVHEADLVFQLERQKGGKPGIFSYSEVDRKMVNSQR
ncbi:ubiquinol-cytochrome C chaperone [Aspergillus sclerotiicarbonarius CBS 121057]|uniref:Ubiquinol-cytochrome C chaperone n=1 Tax=Aspergillus sclerotiicarbonarius (strain CBS 121057 / IBT 28362) TaxID=1448318 RepID=A0A319FL79_ASPSB|nr:ubiquinol-cytochrome C chaperone [Aspergillus sclerotiicarbonarius CBS 121057]